MRGKTQLPYAEHIHIHQIVTDYKIVDQKIQHPVQYQVASSAHSVPKNLLRYPFLEGNIEKIDYFGYIFC